MDLCAGVEKINPPNDMTEKNRVYLFSTLSSNYGFLSYSLNVHNLTSRRENFIALVVVLKGHSSDIFRE